MIIAEDLIQELFKDIDKIDRREIAKHIEYDDLQIWLDNWSSDLKSKIMSIKSCYEDCNGWIKKSEKMPKDGMPVQILICDTIGDSPFTYVECGWCIFPNSAHERWIVRDELLNDKVIAWKPLEKELSPTEMRDIGRI